MSSRTRLALGLAFFVAACGGGSTATRDQTQERAHGNAVDRARSQQNTADSRVSARILGATATYGDLVLAARTLEDRGESDASAGCLLRGTGDVGAAWRLEADVAVAVRPLPAAWDDFDAHLAAHRGPARVLSRWGQTRAESYALALATFTSTMPVDTTTPAAVVVLTDQGAYVLSTVAGQAPSGGAGPVARVTEAIRALQPTPSAFVALTAESGVSLGAVRHALGLLAELGAPVVLAVALAPEVRLPADPIVGPDVADRGLCPNGLPPAAATEPEGDLVQDGLVDRLGPLHEGAARCLATATGRGASGGRLDVALRIGANGTVTEACASRDDPHDAALRICVLEAARSLRFPAPSPAGYVDVVLPLRLAADTSLAQRPLCE